MRAVTASVVSSRLKLCARLEGHDEPHLLTRAGHVASRVARPSASELAMISRTISGARVCGLGKIRRTSSSSLGLNGQSTFPQRAGQVSTSGVVSYVGTVNWTTPRLSFFQNPFVIHSPRGPLLRSLMFQILPQAFSIGQNRSAASGQRPTCRQAPLPLSLNDR